MSLDKLRELVAAAAKQQAIIDAHHADAVDREFATARLQRIKWDIGNSIPDLESLLSRHEALKAAMREKAAKWRKQAEILCTDKPDFSDGLAASREEAAAELEALAEDKT